MTDFFLSYARDDDEPFVKRIYDDLTSRGFSVWWDRRCMPSRALTFFQEIRDAVEASGRLIAVIGPSAVDSDYVRSEWEHAFLFCKEVIPLLRKAPFGDKRDYDIVPEDLSDLPCLDFRESRPYDQALQELLNSLAKTVLPLGPLLNEIPALPPHFLPRRQELDALSAAVLADIQRPIAITSAENSSALTGMGGIGKSVLAAAFARSAKARRACTHGIVWIRFDQSSDLLQKIRATAAAFNDTLANYSNESLARDQLVKLLADKVCLLVLDNVWDLGQAEPFRNAMGPRCRLLITSRDASLATTLGAGDHRIEVLGKDEALKLLAEWAGQEVTTLPPEASEVAKHCGNLPLALSMSGAMICNKNTWKDVRDALNEADLSFIKSHLPNYLHGDLLKSLAVSVDFIQRQDPTCADLYRELVVFHPADPVPEASIMTLWTRNGRMKERYAREKLAKMENLALLRLHGQFPLRLMTLHDLQRDYLVATTDGMKDRHKALLDAYRKNFPQGWDTASDDGYFYQHLAYHLAESNDCGRLRELFIDQSWMNSRVAADKWTYDGYLADLAVTWAMVDGRVNEDDTYLIDSVRYGLIRTSINSLAANYDPEVVVAAVECGLWSIDRALNMIDRMPSKGHAYNNYCLLLSTDKLTETQRLGAEKKALNIALGIDQELSRVKALAAVAGSMRGVGKSANLDKALADAVSIDDEASRAKALIAVVGYLDSENVTALGKALDTAIAIKNEGWRAEALMAVAGQLRDEESATLRSKALIAALGIEDNESKARVLAGIAEHLKCGEKASVLGKALELAISIGNERSRAEALASVAWQLWGEENKLLLSKAFDAAVGLVDKSSLVEALTAVAGQLSGAEKVRALSRAFQAAIAIGDEWSRTEALAAVVGQLDGIENAETLQKAVSAARGIKDTRYKALALAAVARQLTGEEKKRSLHEAVEASLAIVDETWRAEALAGVAVQLIGEEHATSLGKALDAALGIYNEESRSVVMAALAKPLACPENSASLSRALDAALEINDNYCYAPVVDTLNMQAKDEKGETILSLAFRSAIAKKDMPANFVAKVTAEPSGGENERSLDNQFKAALTLRDDESQAQALTAVACKLDGSKKTAVLKMALQSALAIKGKEPKAVALAAVANQLSGAEKTTALYEAHECACAIGDKESKARALAAVAEQLSGTERARVLKSAHECARAIRDKETQANTLAAIAGHLSGEERTIVLNMAFDAAIQIKDINTRTEAQGRLLTRLEAASAKKQFLNILHSYDDLKRSDFLRVCDLLPRLSVERNTLMTIGGTINDICSNWKWL